MIENDDLNKKRTKLRKFNTLKTMQKIYWKEK